MKIFTLIVCLMFVPFAYAQDEDTCNETGDYWSETDAACFAVNDMDFDARELLDTVRRLEAEKAQLLHEQQEYNASGKNTRKQNYDVQIARFEARRDSASDAGVAATYQRKVDQLTVARDFHDDYDVTEHGAQISALSQSIGKHKEELDSLLTP